MVTATLQRAKVIAEDLLLDFDFLAELNEGETILDKTVTATVYSGTDATPSAIISGAATLDGSVVTQKVIDGLLGVQYLLSCAVTTTLGQTLVQRAYLSIL